MLELRTKDYFILVRNCDFDKQSMWPILDTRDMSKGESPALMSKNSKTNITFYGQPLAFLGKAECLGIIWSSVPVIRSVLEGDYKLMRRSPTYSVTSPSCQPCCLSYALSVLLSGLGTLVLSNILYNCHKNTMAWLMKLHSTNSIIGCIFSCWFSSCVCSCQPPTALRHRLLFVTKPLGNIRT